MPNLGDVSIYSTYCYLMELVKARGFETRMVPGVPSFCAVAARLGISLTEMNAPLHIVPGSWDLPQALEWPGNKILMKSGSQMPQVLEAIGRQGGLGRSAMVQELRPAWGADLPHPWREWTPRCLRGISPRSS